MKSLIDMTVYMTVTATIVLLVKALLKNKLTAKYHLLIWLLLLLRLFTPFLPQSGISVFNTVKVPPGEIYQSTEVVETAVDKVENQFTGHEAFKLEEKEISVIDVNRICKYVWALAAFGFFLYFIGVYFLEIKKTSRLKKVQSADMMSLLEECKKNIGTKRKVGLLYGEENPMLIGLLRYNIVLPQKYNYSEKKDIILHELCHLKNNDIFIILIALTVLCINWYNPLIWYAFYVFRKDVEVYCDERVLRYTDNKKSYAELLLKTALSKNRFIPGTTALQNGEKEVERRIKYMAFFEKPKRLWTLITVLLLVVAGVVCLTNSSSDCFMDENKLNKYKERMIGSMMAEIDYADDEKIVFHYYDGLFVYNYKEERLLKSFDLTKLNCAPHQQGSNGIMVKVTADGNEAFLINYGLQEEIKKFDNYIINLNNGKVKTTLLTEPENPFLTTDNVSETFAQLPDATGWFSDICIKAENDDLYYLTVEEIPYVKGIKLIITNNDRKIKNIYYPFESEKSVKISEHTAVVVKDTTLFADYEKQKKISDLEKGDVVHIVNREDDYYFVQLPAMDIPLAFGYVSADYLSFDVMDFSNCNYAIINDAVVYNTEKGNDVYSQSESGLIRITNQNEGGSLVQCTLIGGVDGKWVKRGELTFDFSISEFFGKSPLYVKTYYYLKDEFMRVYTPYYDIKLLEILNWQERENSARFFYKMVAKNYYKDPDTVEYIIQARENNSKNYEVLKKEYLEEKDFNYEFKIVMENDELKLYSNTSPKGIAWVPTRIDDYIMSGE